MIVSHIPNGCGDVTTADQTVSIHSSDCDCNAKRLDKDLGRGERANLIIQGQLRAFPRSPSQ